ncbi:CAP-associated domain-containing protein [Candidatus Enterococcus ferrettii]|uniref:CAP-associated domain-containing protein n=1 Tax=Candidatus Enterococcus ferrettii TaxID=2815324 RepID=A0ABV0ESC4_9ENTE|nr:hypothetical protein [Enterococcus sp. 665A]
MKRALGFISILIIVLIGYYVQPILFPPNTTNTPVEPSSRPAKRNSLKHETVATAGCAQYVGLPVSEIEPDLGSPTKIESSGFLFEIRTYPIEGGSLQVNVVDGNITAIKVIGQENTNSPFIFGMSNSDLAEQMTLSSNFAVNYNDEPIDIELTEDDMRFRPLIAFDNGTFAIPFFDGTNEELFAVSYLDIETLLRVMPYRIHSGNPLSFQAQENNFDWVQVNQQKEQQLFEAINTYRSLKDLTPFSLSTTTVTEGKNMLDSFLEQPQSVLSRSRQDEWATSAEARAGNLSFTLSDKEFQKLAKNQQVNQEAGLFYSPVIDPWFSLFEWISQERWADRFSEETDYQLSIAFNQQNVLVLLQEPEQTKESE